MPYTMEQFRKDYVNAHIGLLDPEEVFSKFKAEERLKGLNIEEVETYLKKLKEKKR